MQAHGQTLSQPYVVAKMSELALAHGRPKKVLELGSGSGYQTAILASLVDEICAIERIKPLMERARQQLLLTFQASTPFVRARNSLPYQHTHQA